MNNIFWVGFYGEMEKLAVRSPVQISLPPVQKARRLNLDPGRAVYNRVTRGGNDGPELFMARARGVKNRALRRVDNLRDEGVALKGKLDEATEGLEYATKPGQRRSATENFKRQQLLKRINEKHQKKWGEIGTAAQKYT